MRYIILILSCLFQTNNAISAHSTEVPTHHMFNTTLLPPNTHQISIVGNYKLGITDNFEIGTQALAFSGAPNIYFKHRMFDLGNNKTTFSSHIFSLQSDGNKSLAGFLNLTSSFKTNQQSILSFGVMDIFGLSTQGNIFKDDLSVTHIYVPTFSWDQYFNSHWMFNFIMAVPFYGKFDLNDDYSEVQGDIFFITSQDDYISFNMATFTYSTSGSFNLEFGTLLFNSGGTFTPSPYLNLFWRFQS